MKVLPNFLVIGVEKGGTTWLHAQLKKHPDIFVPATKEVHFFNRYNSNFKERNHFELGLKWYQDFFADYNNEKAVGEITPMYICDTEAPARIKATLPNVKIIAMLRNPVNRAYSHYWMAKNKGHITGSFNEIINRCEPKIIERGLYCQQLKKYTSLFAAHQLKVLFYEDVFADPKYWLKEICTFLNVDEDFFENDDLVFDKVFEASNYKSSGLLNLQNRIVHALRRNRQISRLLNSLKKSGFSDKVKQVNRVEDKYDKIFAEDKLLLETYYRADVHCLEDLLQRKAPWNF